MCPVVCIPNQSTVYSCNQDEKTAKTLQNTHNVVFPFNDLATFFTFTCLLIKLFTFLNVS